MLRKFLTLCLFVPLVVTSQTAVVSASHPVRQEESGHVLFSSGDAKAAQAIWVQTNGSTNGVFGWVFPIDPGTVGGTFSLKVIPHPLYLQDFGISFFDDMTSSRPCATYGGLGDESGEPCGTHAVVYLRSGADASFLYTASDISVPQDPCLPSVGTPAPDPAGPPAVALHGDTLHSGGVESNLVPTGSRWCLELGGTVLFPLVAEDKVFVSVCTEATCSIQAHDKLSGALLWGPIDAGNVRYRGVSIAYDNGRLFMLTEDGLLQAHDASTGALLWVTQVNERQNYFTGTPVARDGRVFLTGSGGPGNLYAISQEDGATLWTAYLDGSNSSPVVTDDGVFVSHACQRAYRFNVADGQMLWRHDGHCTGGGDFYPSLYRGSLYVESSDSDVKLHATTGEAAGTFASDYLPAFEGDRSFFLVGGILRAVDIASGTVLWTFVGDGMLEGSPFASNGIVYIRSLGKVFGLDAQFGHVVWSDEIPPAEERIYLATDLTIGNGVLVVPSGTTLTVY